MNIILLGFKACGKSTVGAALAAHMGTRFIDTDAEIERLYTEQRQCVRTCRDIYREHGPEFFRCLEAEAIERLGSVSGAVIATGGGAVLHDATVEQLKRVGRSVFLDVPLPVLEERLKEVDSPLFKQQNVEETYRHRRELYLKAADVRYLVEPGASVAKMVDDLCKLIGGEDCGQ